MVHARCLPASVFVLYVQNRYWARSPSPFGNILYDRADRITSADGVSYSVNANGNLVARGSDSFTYDQANRLKSASVGGVASGFAYDGDGKRSSKTVGGNTTSYTYDVNASLPVLLGDGTRKYVWGLGLAYAVDGAGDVLVYHTDGLGSVRALSDGTAAVVQVYRTDEYGLPLVNEGSIEQPFRYTGEQADDYTKFVYLRSRYYDPESGRFLSRDDFGGIPAVPASLHRYGYVLNNPMVAADPSGMCPSGFSQYTPIAAGMVVAGLPAAGEAVIACFATPPCIIAVGVAVGGYYWWTHGGAEATAQAAGDLSTWFTRNPAGDKPLSKGEIEKLKRAGVDIHDLKGESGASRWDLYKDKKGNIYVKPKGGAGGGEPTGLNINDF